MAARTSGHRGKPASEAELRRMVADGMTAREIGEVLDISLSAARCRLVVRGIGSPRRGPRPIDPSAMVELYAAGVNIAEIAGHLGVSVRIVRINARAAGLSPRPLGSRGITLAQYRETLLAKAMAETARIEQRQIKLAEMWDQPHHGGGKKRAA